MPKMRSLVNAIAMTVLALASAFSAHAGTMVSITSPIPGTAVPGTTTVKIHLAGAAAPATLKVQENGVDVTTDFNVSSCAAVPCDISATLTADAGQIISGWNKVYARVESAQGMAEYATVPFLHTVGVSDSTNGSGPPYSVKFFAYENLNFSSAFVLHYAPPLNTNVSYPVSACGSGQVSVTVLNRGDAQPTNSSPTPLSLAKSSCFNAQDNASLQAFFTSLTKNQMVLVAGPINDTPGAMNFAPVGGTDFTAQNAPVPYNYMLVGSGGSAAGVGYEAYRANAQEAAPYFEGRFVNTSPTATVYAYEPSGTYGFAVVPANLSSTGKGQVVIGNVADLGLGVDNPPNQELPAMISIPPTPIFNSQTYTSPDGSPANGLWMLVVDRQSLSLVSSKVYSTFDSPAGQCPEWAQLASDITSLDSTKLIFLSSIGLPVSAADPTCMTEFASLMGAVSSLGASQYSLSSLAPDNFGTTAGGTFSLVGIHSTTLPRTVTAIAETATQNQARPNAQKWWSSTREAIPDTGALHGVLAEDHSLQYQPTSVSPFDPATVGASSTPTADDLLRHALSQAIGSAPTVYWPYTNDTLGHQAAYAYLSNWLVTRAFYSCTSLGCSCPTSAVCNDVRFYYTGSQLDTLLTVKEQIGTIPYPGDGNGFSSQEFTDLASQLQVEFTYLQNVEAYKHNLDVLNTTTSQGVGVALTTAATQVAADLNSAFGTPQQIAIESPIQMAIDVLNTAAGVASFGGAIPLGEEGKSLTAGMQILSGLLWGGSGTLQSLNDADVNAPVSDPYVTQLGDLLSQTSSVASKDAMKFSNDLWQSTGMFFDGVYSDWFKLQTMGLLVVNSQNPGWYYQDVGNVATDYASSVVASERGSLLEQLFPQYMGIVETTDVPSWYMINDEGFTLATVDADVELSSLLFGIAATDGSKLVRTEISAPPCRTYSFAVSKQSAKPWPSSIGDMLFNAPDQADGLGSLGISPNFFYFMMPTLRSSFYTGQGEGPGGEYEAHCVPASSLGASQQSPTTTQLASSSNSVGTGEDLTLTATVKGATGSNDSLTGTVVISSNDNSLAVLQIPTGSVGTATVTTTLHASTLPLGANSFTASYSGDATDTSSTSGDVTVTVGAPSFAIASDTSVLSLADSYNAQAGTVVTVTPDFSFSSTVQLSCAGLPANSTCSFGSSELTPNGSAVHTTLTFVTSNIPKDTAMNAKQIAHRGAEILACGVFGLFLFRRRSRLLMLSVVLILSTFVTGCGSAVRPAVAGSYPITINAIGGGITKAITVTLNIR
jgi:Bacterial Ig-like domain (group 3)